MPVSDPAFSAALAAHQSGQLDAALDGYRAVLARGPQHADARALYAVALAERGNPQTALPEILAALQLDPHAALFHFYHGNILAQLGNTDKALDAYHTALRHTPDFPQCLFNVGNLQRQLGARAEAQKAFEAALKYEPGMTSARHHLGLIKYERGDAAGALPELRLAAQAAPDDAEIHVHLSMVHEALKQFEDALASADAALRLAPQHPRALFGKAVALHRLGRETEAEIFYQQALAQNPRWPEAWDNLGQCRQAVLDLGGARAAFAQGLQVAPAYRHNAWNLALLDLLEGNLERGFKDYRVRYEAVDGLIRDHQARRRLYGDAEWRGEPLGRPLLVVDEQGFGDTLMFCRALPLLVDKGWRVILQCHPALAPLLDGQWAGVTVIPRAVAEGTIRHRARAELPEFAAHCSLMDLPGLLGLCPETIPGAPYLRVPGGIVAPSLPPGAGLRVGVVWAGQPKHVNDARRSLALSTLAPLTTLPGIRFFSFQKDQRPGDAERLHSLGIADLGPSFRSFADTAAAMKLLDLFICVDTSVAHLAGALGVPTLLLLPFSPDWRWQTGRTDSPWYSSLTLIRQDVTREWAPVLAQVDAELRARTQPVVTF